MRLAEGDRVVAIAAFRAGLAERVASRTMAPLSRAAAARPRVAARDGVVRPFSFGRTRVYADQFEIYHGNSNPDLAGRSPAGSARSAARPRSSSSRTRTSSSRSSTTSARRTSSSSSRRVTRSPVDHGAPDHDRRVQAGERRADHGRHPVLRLRPVGQEGPAAGSDHGPPDRRHDHGRRRRPGPDDGPPPGPDPGLLQHPGRRADRGPPALELLHPQAPRGRRRRHRPRASRSGPGRSPSCSTRRSRSSRSGGSATSTGPS